MINPFSNGENDSPAILCLEQFLALGEASPFSWCSRPSIETKKAGGQKTAPFFFFAYSLRSLSRARLGWALKEATPILTLLGETSRLFPLFRSLKTYL